MSKKAKGVVLGGFSPMSLDAKARCKSQTLLLEYQDLQKETYGVRMKLDSAKQRREELLAEVRFLRKRHRYLVKIKSMERQAEQQSNIPQQLHIENQIELTTKGRKLHKSEAARFKMPPLPEKPKGRDYARIASKNVSSSSLAPNHKLASQSGNWMDVASQHNLKDVNYRKRVSRDNSTAFRDTIHLIETENFQSGGNVTMSKTPSLDLNLDNGGVVRKEETVLPTRIPTFDLNEVSMEEDEVIQVGGDEQARSEESKRSVIRAGYDEQANDMKISSSVCRNNSGEGGGGGPSRIGKRKISWQDPVALRV